MKQAEEARREVVEFKYCNSEREHELTRKLSHDAFEARGLARSRYHTRLFQQGRPRPTNEEFDEGFDAGVEYARSWLDPAPALSESLAAIKTRKGLKLPPVKVPPKSDMF